MTQSKIKPKILIVDDEAGDLYFLKLEFKRDYLVLTAESGEEALEILKKEENRDIALILSDQQMPRGMSGTDLLKQSIDTHPHTIRMIITAYLESYIDEFQVDKFFKKPLKEKIQELRESFEQGIYIYNLRRENDYLLNDLTKVIEKDMRLRNLFSKYLSPELIGKFEKKDPKTLLEVEEKEITILYSDICGFTRLAENLEPREVVELLNKYFGVMSGIIVKHNGTIDKYIGDAIMAVFGTKEYTKTSSHEDAKNAVCCAWEMKQALRDFNVNNHPFPPIQFGIGINTGNAVVGNIGSDYLLDYTVIGDVVNTAARIQKLTRKKPGTNYIYLGENTYEYAREIIGSHFEKLGPMELKGKEKKILIYELLDLA
jgi:class 3 adenylate cyclase